MKLGVTSEDEGLFRNPGLGCVVFNGAEGEMFDGVCLVASALF